MERIVRVVCSGPAAAVSVIILLAILIGGVFYVRAATEEMHKWFSFESKEKANKPNDAFVQVADIPPFYFVRGDLGKDDAKRVELAYAEGCSVKAGGEWRYREMPRRETNGTTRTAIALCPALNYEGAGDVELAFPAFAAKEGELLLPTDEVIVKMKPGHDLWHIVASMGVAASRPMKDAERTYVIALSPQGHANPMERSRELFWRAEVEWAQPNFVRIWQR